MYKDRTYKPHKNIYKMNQNKIGGPEYPLINHKVVCIVTKGNKKAENM